MKLDADMPFEELKEAVREKFAEAAGFFREAKTVLAFDGRQLTREQEEELLQIIDEATELKILCIVEKDMLEQKAVDREQGLQEGPEDEEERSRRELSGIGQFFKGTLRSGQILETETSIILIGDVEAGAQVISKGNIVVLGALLGSAHAGAPSRNSAFVAALSMHPAQIKIGGYRRRGRSPGREKPGVLRPKAARVKDGRICLETITKEDEYYNHQNSLEE